MMEIQPLQTLETTLATFAERFEWRDDYRLDIFTTPLKLHDAIGVLMGAGYNYLSAITGVDYPAAEDAGESDVELIYSFCEGPYIVSLRIRIPYSNPVAPSVCGLLPYATLYERELIEMFGVVLTETPSTERLFLSDDWPDGVYPLRKSFKGL